jgi:hypothetical protein
MESGIPLLETKNFSLDGRSRQNVVWRMRVKGRKIFRHFYFPSPALFAQA